MKKYIPLVLAFAWFIETLDATIISTAIPKMAVSLGVNPINLKVALTSYLLSLAIFIPISGWFADRFGTRKVFVTAVSIFTVGSLFCGLAINVETLVLSRIIQGIGGALMIPVGRIILLKSFSKVEFVKATNYLTIPSLIGPALGPVLGGLIVSYVSWRWIFIVNIPMGLLGMIVAFNVLPDYKNHTVSRLDFVGFMLFGVGLAGFVFALESIGQHAVSTMAVVVLMLISVGLLFLYFIRSRTVKFPFINLAVFKIKTFRITTLAGFLSRCGIGGMPFLLPLFFQLSLGRSPLYSGVLLLPYAMGMLFLKFFLLKILRLFGFKAILVVNTCLLGLFVLLFCWVDAKTSVGILIPVLFVYGVVTSLQFSCVNILSYTDLRPNIVSQGISIASTLQQLSMSFGIAIAAMTLRYLLGQQGNPLKIPAQVFHGAFLVLGLVTLSAIFIFMLLDKRDGLEASRHRKYHLQ